MNSIETFYIRDMATGITYFFDGYISGSITEQATITSYPTIEGTPMSDYSYKELNTLTVSLAVSDLNASGRYLEYTGGVYYAQGTADLKKLIKSWQADATLLLVQTRTDQYENMCLQSLSYTESEDTRGTFAPTLTLKEHRRAVLQTIMLGPFDSAESRASSITESNTGNDSGTSVASAAGEVLGVGATGAIAGAKIGAMVGHPVIGGIVGGVVGIAGGILNVCGRELGWWDA